MPSRPGWWQLAAVLAATALVTVGRFGNGWVWDDIAMFVHSDFLFDLGNAGALFAHNTMFASDGGAFAQVASLDTYRPLTMLAFMFDAAWGGRHPFPFHVSGLLCHLAVVALVFACARKLLGEPARAHAWAPALFVGIHPLLDEAHVWINGRSDTLSTTFVLAGALLIMDVPGAEPREPRRRGRAIGAGGLFLCALLSKETALFALPPLLLWQAGFFTGAWPLRIRAALVSTAPFLVALPIYFGLRASALGGLKASGGQEHVAGALWRLPFYVLDGLVHVVAPWRIAPRFMMEEYAAISSVWFALAWGVALLLAFAVFALRRRMPVFGFGLVWFASTLSPAVLISLLKWYGFGRYLYLPVTFLAIGALQACALLARSVPLRPSIRRYALLAAAAYAALLAQRSTQYVRDFASPETFYAAIVRDYPERSHGYGGAGRLLVERGAAAQAVPILERAIALGPDDQRHWNNLVQAQLRSGNARAARAVAGAAIARFPRAAKFHHALALASAPTQPEAAVAALLAGLRKEPAHPASRALLNELVSRHPRRAEYAALVRRELAKPANASLQAELAPLLPRADP